MNSEFQCTQHQPKSKCTSFTEVVLYGNRYWFSYSTLVAFRDGNSLETYVTKEYFSPTTTKHINKYVKSWDRIAGLIRLSPEEFEDKLNHLRDYRDS